MVELLWMLRRDRVTGRSSGERGVSTFGVFVDEVSVFDIDGYRLSFLMHTAGREKKYEAERKEEDT